MKNLKIYNIGGYYHIPVDKNRFLCGLDIVDNLDIIDLEYEEDSNYDEDTNIRVVLSEVHLNEDDDNGRTMKICSSCIAKLYR